MSLSLNRHKRATVTQVRSSLASPHALMPSFTQPFHEHIDVKLVKASRKRKLGGTPLEPRKKKGKLSALLELMPNEILVHICSYLYPTDLLHVARSAKIFALFLLAPSSAQIWYSSRQELDSEMPERPNDLSEQQYCAMIFGLHCQVHP
ncbi:hypothetical protein DL93DRAFT_1113178 [Clavulina sp. PMI_390]|nr:hypothetical protein DL93DRAFT_1113178 [Clavulina sp. PMI_390]